MKPTLVILAAGMASRYGSMKQVQGFGPNGETIMDYSIYDAIRAGFGKVVFIIRKEFADNFKTIFEPKLNGKVQTEYVFQEMDYYTEGYKAAAERTKPWGTAHAVLCAKEVVKEPFAVINADDFYGSNAFENAASFLNNGCNENVYAIVGYDLLRTLSDHGTVNRGVCGLDADGNLATVTERINIAKKEGKILCEDGLEPKELSLETRVSMNFWCFDPSFFAYTQKLFIEFLHASGQELKSEFFIPIVADQFIKEGGKVEIIPTTSNWFGVTYKEDAPFVQNSLNTLIEKGEYPAKLW
ncbi:MAG TPA: sugar phosphate nucleotidyltransferase [Chitinophagaceae bacterium]|nr:sugar phosphate nucleotidyltransferase [Chitinophagaceae bacterium]HPH31813.1 sugar phosphate nucleotidyltransferase [Chitinophagaceae bacterium]HPN59017.1 sugar phosphate nucleotidyltransferase [Chitinophagaceae bacterium]